MQQWLSEETAKVVKEKDGLFERWVKAKAKEHHKMTKEELKDCSRDDGIATKVLLETFKKFAKDVLTEFKA